MPERTQRHRGSPTFVCYSEDLRNNSEKHAARGRRVASAWARLRARSRSATAAMLPMAHVDPMMAPLPRSYGQHDEERGKDHDGQTASMQSSTELTATVSLQTMSILDALDVALAGLESDEVHDRALAARQLTTLVEGVYGEDAAAVGSYVRESNALEMLLELVRVPARRQCRKRTAPCPCTPAVLTPPCCLQIADPVAEIHQKVLMVVGNLVSDAVDPQVRSLV